MADQPKRISQTLLLRVQAGSALGALSPIDRLWVALVIACGVGASALAVLWRSAPAAVFFGATTAGWLAVAASPALHGRLLGRTPDRRHALYLLFFWLYALLGYAIARLQGLIGQDATGKGSEYYYLIVGMAAVCAVFALRSLLGLTPWGRRALITDLPVWEQLVIAANEFIAFAILILLGAQLGVRLTQPALYTTALDPVYTVGVLGLVAMFTLGATAMWWRRLNDALSRTPVWLRLARLIAPLAFAVVAMIIIRRFLARADLRSATLLGEDALSLAVLAFAPLMLLLLGGLLYILFTSGRGLRERFLPDALLDRLPARLSAPLRTMCDMDMFLIGSLLALLVPGYLILLRDSGGLVGGLRAQIMAQGSALVETSEQAIALVFAAPFYALIIALLVLYALVLGRASLSADEREALVRRLPIGFLISLVIALYLVAVPFSQVLTEGRLPQFPQDTGRILAYNVAIPLALLYAHYFLLVRIPYRRGQMRWRAAENTRIGEALGIVERRLDRLNEQLRTIDVQWAENSVRKALTQPQQIDALYQYVHMNSQRDDLNMQRLKMLSTRQALTEVNETPVTIAVARLPLRVVSLGIPLLIVIQLYQWAVVNDGLRTIVNDPDLTVFDFFRAILQQLQF
jgi:hypothetical protein